MIEYLAIVATVAAVASVVRCVVAIAEYRRERLTFINERGFLRVVESGRAGR